MACLYFIQNDLVWPNLEEIESLSVGLACLGQLEEDLANITKIILSLLVSGTMLGLCPCSFSDEVPIVTADTCTRDREFVRVLRILLDL